MTEFKNGDVLRHKTHTDKTVIFIGVSPKNPSLFVGEHVEDTVLSVHALSNWELKPKKEKRYFAASPQGNTSHLYKIKADLKLDLNHFDRHEWTIYEIEVEV